MEKLTITYQGKEWINLDVLNYEINSLCNLPNTYKPDFSGYAYGKDYCQIRYDAWSDFATLVALPKLALLLVDQMVKSAHEQLTQRYHELAKRQALHDEDFIALAQKASEMRTFIKNTNNWSIVYTA